MRVYGMLCEGKDLHLKEERPYQDVAGAAKCQGEILGIALGASSS